ncbi:unnamed protein product [Adineta ricciae]|uniref:DUF229 domain containing protein n=1 Tax=Adineta ricciae TaxID=249248 RepID=A0A815GNJ4_ADIRI|nr:unnamed protein product [Adineta ricciae]
MVGLSKGGFNTEISHVKSSVNSAIIVFDKNYSNKTFTSCQYPKLTIDNPQILKYLKPVKESRPKCDDEVNWIYTKNSTFYIRDEAIKVHGSIQCGYRPITRAKDDFNKSVGERIFPFESHRSLVSDFFHVDCQAQDGSKYENYHMGIKYNSSLLIKNFESPMKSTSLDYNVLMFGFDSTSRMTFMRFLPKTYSFLVNELGAIVMKGYNIVGDGTPAALFPILTGQTEQELPESRRGYPKATTVDDFPWIWNDFKKNGFITQWAEDMSYVGTFQYRLKGFRNPPVDYYGRPFYLYVESQKVSKPYCFGSITRLQGMFEWIKEYVHLYSNEKKFSFLFHSDYSHNSNNNLPYADQELFQFLQYLRDLGYLNKTILLILTDHGARYSHLRATPQGKLEERLPFVSIRMPDEFQKQNPEIMKNLRSNSERLSTPFDIYETFEHILSFHSAKPYRSRYARSVSLFNLIPADRTCLQANISEHWCTCLQWKAISINESTIELLAKQTLQYLNDYLSGYEHLCSPISLKRIAKASQMNDNEKVFYQMEFETNPGEAKFELTSEFHAQTNSFDIQKRFLSRINQYGQTANCIAQIKPDLREICFCKNISTKK